MKVIDRNKGLAANMIGTNAKLPDFRPTPLFNPNLTVQRNARIQEMVAQINPINPKNIRAETIDTLRRSVDAINRHMAESQQYHGVRFTLHEESGRRYATVVDQRTGEQIAQIPSESLLSIAARLREASGLLVNTMG